MPGTKENPAYQAPFRPTKPLGRELKRQCAADRRQFVEQAIGFLDQTMALGIELAFRAIAGDKSGLASMAAISARRR